MVLPYRNSKWRFVQDLRFLRVGLLESLLSQGLWGCQIPSGLSSMSWTHPFSHCVLHFLSFFIRGSQSCCPQSCCPLSFLQVQDVGKGGVEFKVGSLHGGLAVLESTLPSHYSTIRQPCHFWRFRRSWRFHRGLFKWGVTEGRGIPHRRERYKCLSAMVP